MAWNDGYYNEQGMNGYNQGTGGYNNYGYSQEDAYAKQYKKLTRDYQKLAEMQQLQQTGIVFERNESWDSTTNQIIEPVNKNLHTRLQGSQYTTGELLIAQFMYRVEKFYEQQSGLLEGYTCDPLFRLSIADTQSYIHDFNLKFQRIDEVTFTERSAKGIVDVRHICDGGISGGTYEEVPLTLYDIVSRRDMSGYTMNYWKVLDFSMCQERVKFYYCPLCGQVLYTYNY